VKILVTGGAGFIGSNYVRMIADSRLNGYSEVTILDKLTYAGIPANLDGVKSLSNFRFVEGDICDLSLVASLMTRVDCVINFAAESHVDRSIISSREFVHTNVLGVQVILDAIQSQKKPVRLLQVSTDEVYGSIEQGSWTEESPIAPNSPYSASKAGGELLAMSYHRTFGTDLVITRSSNNYGTHHFPEKLIPLFITNLIEDKKLPIYGDGKNIRDWLHVDDHCRGIHLALTRGTSGQIYNIGGGTELTNLEITNIILQLMNRSQDYIEHVKDRQGHDQRYSLDWKKIGSTLGYRPQIAFEDGLRETIDWYEKNPLWWKPIKNGF